MDFDAVPYGKEFERIIKVPRRTPPDPFSEESKKLADFLTDRFARVSDPYPGRLLPAQALSLKEGWECKGGFGQLRAGFGKTVLAFLLPEVWQAARPVIFTTAAMIPDMEVERRKMAKDWHLRGAAKLPIVSYSALSAPSGGEELNDRGEVIRLSLIERMAPTHIILDESHSMANAQSTGCKRMNAYLKKFPNTVVWAMTGTPFKKHIHDCAHILRWCLKDNTPLPTHSFFEEQTWGSYLDAETGGFVASVGVGALIEFLSAAEKQSYRESSDRPGEQVSIVRKAIARRILETPGVIGTPDSPVSTKLEVTTLLPNAYDDGVETLFDHILNGEEGWTLPDGTEIPDSKDLARHKTNAGYGFFQIWQPPPPQEWRFARNQWARWCRKTIQTNRIGVDSEARVKDAVRKGLIDDCWSEDETQALTPKRPDLCGTSRLANWETCERLERERTGKNEPDSIAVFVSEQAVEVARRWLESEGEGLIWTNSIGLGELLEKGLGLPYYRAGGLDAQGRHIKNHRGGSAIASVKANGTGRNLQKFWCRALWFCQPGEQSLARIHRAGQTASVVKNWVYIGCQNHLKSLYAARDVKAAFAEEMTLSPQRLTYADSSIVSPYELAQMDGIRWALPEEKEP